MRWLLCLFLLLSFAARAQVPAPASAVGYNTLTYGPSVTVGADPTTVPLSPGSTWQRFAFFGNAWQSDSVTQNADGSVTIGTGQPGSFGDQMSTAAPINDVTKTYIQGTAFGGGFYAEVTMSFALNFPVGGPAFWANDIESMAGGSEGDVSLRHWPSQVRNYGDWIENDITEFDNGTNGGGCQDMTHPCLGFAMHNFFGPGSEFSGQTFQVNDQTVNAGNLYTQTVSPTCVTGTNTPPTGTGTGIVDGTCHWNFVSTFSPSSPVSTSGSGSRAQQPNGTDFTQKHKYAALWVPATASTQGFVKYYFDGTQIGNTCTWNQYNSATAPPPVDNSSPCGGSSAYSVMDTRHMALILGNAAALSGQNPGPVTIYSVNVWQKDATQDIGPTNSTTLASGGALPSGYFSVSGNQIQDGSGNNLRIAATTYRGASTNLSMMQAIRSAGFNSLKIDWRDTGLTSQTASGSCGTLSELDTCVANAQTAGLKVLLSHRGNELPKTSTSTCNARQANGLWFDSGGSSGNDDGCGDGGNVTYAAFKANTVALLKHYAGNSTVIGYEMHHEPLVIGSFTGQPGSGGAGGSGTGSGQFVANKGAITDPNGNAWVGRGFNITTEDVQAGNVPLATLQKLFPRVNYVRVSNFLGGGYTDGDDPTNSTISAWTKTLTDVGIRVEFSDYAGNSPACRTGSDLINASNWYKKVSTFYTVNPFVGYESQNECFDSGSGPFTWAPQVASNYSAVRGGWFPGIAIPNAGYIVTNGGNSYTAQAACTGNTSGTGPSGTGSGIVDGSCRWNFASGNPTPSGGAPKSMFVIGSPGGNVDHCGTYLNTTALLNPLTNVAWDLHPYAGSYESSTSSCDFNTTATQSAFNAQLLSSNMIAAWTAWTTTSEGSIPVILGEFGNSTNGSDVDANGQLAANAGANALSTSAGGASGVGYWLWFCSCNPAGVGDQITTGGSNPSINTVNAYGPSVQSNIAAAPGTGPTPLNGGGGGTSPACTVATTANSCSLSQTQVNAVMSAINTEQQAEVPGGECFGGICYPQNALVGDTIITTAGGLQLTGNVPVSLTDSANNTWTLHAGQTCQGNAANWWWGGIDLNGVQQFCGYSIAIRKLANGHVWVEEAKQAGWWDLTAVQAGGTKSYVMDPGPGPNNVNPTGGTPNAAVSWGGGGDTDVRSACSDVGAAVFAVNPGVIEFCPGPINNATALLNGGAKP